MSNHAVLARADAFCEAFNIRVPILMAPMGSVSPVSLAIAIANAGGLAGCGATQSGHNRRAITIGILGQWA